MFIPSYYILAIKSDSCIYRSLMSAGLLKRSTRAALVVNITAQHYNIYQFISNLSRCDQIELMIKNSCDVNMEVVIRRTCHAASFLVP